MAEKQNLVLNWICLLCLVILLIGSFTWMIAPAIKVPTADEIAAKIKLPVAKETDLSEVNARLAEIEASVNEEKDWKNEAKALATAEWEKNSYKEIFKAIDDIYGNIDDKKDIDYVTIKSEEVSSFNVEDKDATVIQNLKVRYENKDGDNEKVYLTVTTVIDENEVEDQEIDET